MRLYRGCRFACLLISEVYQAAMDGLCSNQVIDFYLWDVSHSLRQKYCIWIACVRSCYRKSSCATSNAAADGLYTESTTIHTRHNVKLQPMTIGVFILAKVTFHVVVIVVDKDDSKQTGFHLMSGGDHRHRLSSP